MMSMPQPAAQAVRRGLTVVTMMLCGLVLGGCCQNDPARHTVNVSLEGFANKPAIEVHLIGVNKAEEPKWRNLSMGGYWKAQERFRESSDKVVLRFGGNNPTSQTFAPGMTTSGSGLGWDDAWKRWEAKQVDSLYVLAFIPGEFADQPGDSDQRRAILPLGKCRWKKLVNGGIKVVLTPTGIQVITPPEKLED